MLATFNRSSIIGCHKNYCNNYTAKGTKTCLSQESTEIYNYDQVLENSTLFLHIQLKLRFCGYLDFIMLQIIIC